MALGGCQPREPASVVCADMQHAQVVGMLVSLARRGAAATAGFRRGAGRRAGRPNRREGVRLVRSRGRFSRPT